MKGGSQVLLKSLRSNGEMQVNKPEWHSGGEDYCKEMTMTGHKSSWESLGFSLLRRKCLSCILMTRREAAELRARESLLCRGRHMCTA